MNHEVLKRRAQTNKDNDERLRSRRRGTKVRDDFYDDNFVEDWNTDGRKTSYFNVADDEDLT